MAQWLFLSILVWLPLTAIFSMLAWRTFDRMLRNLYTVDRDAWIRLGRPAGFFWRPAELGWSGGGYSAVVMRDVVTDTPAHMRLLIASDAAFGSNVERAYYRPRKAARICMGMWWICFLGALALIPFS